MDTVQRYVDYFFVLAMSPIGFLVLLGIVVFGFLVLKGPKGAR